MGIKAIPAQNKRQSLFIEATDTDIQDQEIQICYDLVDGNNFPPKREFLEKYIHYRSRAMLSIAWHDWVSVGE